MTKRKNGKRLIGLAAASPEVRRAVSSMGGLALPPEKRVFSYNRAKAVECGKKSGPMMKAKDRPFSDKMKASFAGRRGHVLQRKKEINAQT